MGRPDTDDSMTCEQPFDFSHGSPGGHNSPISGSTMDCKTSVSTPATVASSDSPFYYNSSGSTVSASSSTTSSTSLRMPRPTSVRPSIDPRYAVRLSVSDSPEQLTPPPEVHRFESSAIFRPSSLLAGSDSPSHKPSDSWSIARPPPKRARSRNDRYIPSRPSPDSSLHLNLWDGVQTPASSNSNNSSNNNIEEPIPEATPNDPSHNAFASNSQRNTLQSLLQSEVMRDENAGRPHRFASRPGNPLDPTSIVNAFSLCPATSEASQRLVAAPSKRKRRISKVPFKVLDAPALQDDFYLNLVDWSSQNVLAVGLGSCVYLWSACTSKVTKLCDLGGSDDTVTAVSWAQRGMHLSVGTNKGEVQLWDTTRCKKVRSMNGHSARVGTLAWSGPVLASGSRDRLIYLRDVRVQASFTNKLTNHRQEVCGLRWSYEEPAFLASGGNDNNLHVIDSRNPTEPLHKFTEHTAAVKAIAWSPHQHGLLASGGGTADRCIRFWNTLSGASLNKIDTGSQVCNLAWSQNCNEIVSTHGYSLNQIVVWRYPTMSKVTTLTGHTYRVLYLAMSPDGSTVVTGAGDETLRFWQIFPGPRSDGKDSGHGLLFPQTVGSVIR